MTSLTPILSAIDSGVEASLERLFRLVEIPSVSTDPAHAADCRRAAEWVVSELSSLGFDASVRETAGQPMVVAHSAERADNEAPHVLFYGHYDVQPADPIELWETPPFEPRLREGPRGRQIVGRGTADDKGQFMTFIEACRAWIAATGKLPMRVTILLEGEEECGSKSLGPFLDAHADELRADIALVCDTGMWDRDTPAITMMLRGLLLEEVFVTAADRDLHSGMFGGAAPNPIHILARIIADLHGPDGRVQLPAFYDGVDELPEEMRRQWDGLGFDDSAFLAEIGLAAPGGEAGRSLLEKIWARPTCEVNGIIGGYTGEGSKTVIPSRASAKFSFRLVGRQEPLAIRESFRSFVRDRLPAGCTAEFLSHGASPGMVLDTSQPAFKSAAAALREEFGRDPVMMGSGGSIPIVGDFKSRLGMDTIMIGFGLDDDRIHSPNEKYELSSFHRGTRAWARVIDALANGRA